MTLCAIVTRPEAQARAWVSDLEAQLTARAVRDVTVAALPLMAIRPLDDRTPLHQAWSALGRYALVFFVSANAVRHFFEARSSGLAWPAGTLAAAPGPGTASALREVGVPPECIVAPSAEAPSFDSEHLWDRLKTKDWRAHDVLIVRGEAGRDWLAEQLRAAGARPHYLAAYARGAPEWGADAQRLLAAARTDPAGHLWMFSSSEAVRHLTSSWRVPPGARALATHPRIAAAARAAGFDQVQETAATLPAVTEALVAAAAYGHGPEGGSVQSLMP